MTIWRRPLSITALSGTASSFLALAVYRIGVGIGESSATPAAYSMLSDSFPPHKRAFALALYAAGLYVGQGVGYYLSGFTDPDELIPSSPRYQRLPNLW